MNKAEWITFEFINAQPVYLGNLNKYVYHANVLLFQNSGNINTIVSIPWLSWSTGFVPGETDNDLVASLSNVLPQKDTFALAQQIKDTVKVKGFNHIY